MPDQVRHDGELWTLQLLPPAAISIVFLPLSREIFGFDHDHPVPGAVIAMQTFGDFLDCHPHLHIISTNGCFSKDGAFMVSPRPCAKDLEDAFRKEVFGMLKKEGKITDAVIENMMGWHHNGFNIYCGPTIWPHDEAGLENLARYIIRASFSQEKITPYRSTGQAIYSGRTFR